MYWNKQIYPKKVLGRYFHVCFYNLSPAIGLETETWTVGPFLFLTLALYPLSRENLFRCTLLSVCHRGEVTLIFAIHGSRGVPPRIPRK